MVSSIKVDFKKQHLGDLLCNTRCYVEISKSVMYSDDLSFICRILLLRDSADIGGRDQGVVK
jgi:hypothetical protein